MSQEDVDLMIEGDQGMSSVVEKQNNRVKDTNYGGKKRHEMYKETPKPGGKAKARKDHGKYPQ